MRRIQNQLSICVSAFGIAVYVEILVKYGDFAGIECGHVASINTVIEPQISLVPRDVEGYQL